MADWIMRLQTLTGLYIGEIPFFDLQGEFRMNEPDEIRFKTSSKDLIKWVDPVNQLEAGITEVVLLRDNIPIFCGPIWNITCSSENKYLSITANDIMSYLKQRVIMTDTKFTKKRFAYAAWKLIQDTQARTYGDLGITLGLDASTGTGSFSYTKKSGTTIYKAIEKLATGTNGFDWEITPDRKLMMYYPRIQTQSKIALEYGANILKYSVQQMGTYAANEVFVRGSKKLISDTFSDTASKLKYGLRHFVQTQSSLKSKTKLNDYARGQLNLRKAPRLIPQLTIDSSQLNPFEDDFGYGYLANTIIDDGWVQFDGVMRCSGFQLTVGKHGQESFVLYVNDTREITDTAV